MQLYEVGFVMLNSDIILQNSLYQYASIFNLTVGVIDADNQLIFSAGMLHDQLLPVSIITHEYAHVFSHEKQFCFCLPLMNGSEEWKILVICNDEARISQYTRSLKILVEGIMLSNNSEDHYPSFYSESIKKRTIVNYLLSSASNKALKMSMSQYGLDASLPRSVICIDLAFEAKQYYNIKMDLEYLPQIELARIEILNSIQQSKYLNAQDLCVLQDDERIVIIKAFAAGSNLSRTYQALEKICSDMLGTIASQYLITPRCAFGGVYSDASMLYKSYREALELIHIGKNEMPKQKLVLLHQCLFSTLYNNLPESFYERAFTPLIDILKRSFPKDWHTIIDTGSTFAESCMNHNKASERLAVHRNTLSKRLDQLKTAAGLDITVNPSDAVLIILMSIYCKYEEGFVCD